jgi:hypothetical protein
VSCIYGSGSFCGCIGGVWSCDGQCPQTKPTPGTPCGPFTYCAWTSQSFCGCVTPEP